MAPGGVRRLMVFRRPEVMNTPCAQVEPALKRPPVSGSTVPDGSSARECFVESQEGPQRLVGRARVRKPGS